jgi:hypothetical protein
MESSVYVGRPRAREEVREDWLPASVLSGFVATVAMTLVLAAAYGLAWAVGSETGNMLQRWFWALAHNPVTVRTAGAIALAIGLNLLMGLGLAIVYARWVEPALTGPPWRKGVVFALVPWVISLVAFLPIMGGGILGRDIGAGPLPVIGNLILHLVYGAVLGAFYAIPLEADLDDPAAERAHALSAERGAAVGVIAGLVIGLALGWVFGPMLGELGDRSAVALAGALVGSALGLGVGSFVGLGKVRPSV